MNKIDLKREDYCCDIMESTTRKKDRFIMHLNLFVDKIYYDQASKKSQLHFQVIDFDTSIHALILEGDKVLYEYTQKINWLVSSCRSPSFNNAQTRDHSS